jgi:hypothetical protein
MARGGFFEHQGQQHNSVTNIVPLIVTNLVTPKAGTKESLFNKPSKDLLKNSFSGWSFRRRQ